MHIVRSPLTMPHPPQHKTILIPVERTSLSRRRWRATAEDGTEFGFDTTHPLHDGDPVFDDGTRLYVLSLKPEPLLEIALPHDPAAAALLAWKIGNLHFPLQIQKPASLRVPDDPALRQLMERENIPFDPITAPFHPATAAHPHTHHHTH